MKKYTKAIAGAMALVSAVTAFSGCSGSGTPAASGATSSSARFNYRRDIRSRCLRMKAYRAL